MADEINNLDGDETLRDEMIEKLFPDPKKRANFQRLIGQFTVDAEALVVLKGHLVIEERITAAIEKFVFHPEHLDKARLNFAQKVGIARSMSLDEQANNMWNLILRLNALRNTLSHSLDGEPRVKAMRELRAVYSGETGGLEKDEMENGVELLAGVCAMCLGFIEAFENEVERFKSYVNLMDRVINPHRHIQNSEKS